MPPPVGYSQPSTNKTVGKWVVRVLFNPTIPGRWAGICQAARAAELIVKLRQ